MSEQNPDVVALTHMHQILMQVRGSCMVLYTNHMGELVAQFSVGAGWDVLIEAAGRQLARDIQRNNAHNPRLILPLVDEYKKLFADGLRVGLAMDDMPHPRVQ